VSGEIIFEMIIVTSSWECLFQHSRAQSMSHSFISTSSA